MSRSRRLPTSAVDRGSQETFNRMAAALSDDDDKAIAALQAQLAAMQADLTAALADLATAQAAIAGCCS